MYEGEVERVASCLLIWGSLAPTTPPLLHTNTAYTTGTHISHTHVELLKDGMPKGYWNLDLIVEPIVAKTGGRS